MAARCPAQDQVKEMMPEQTSHPLDRLCRTAASARRSLDVATAEPAVLARITLACRTTRQNRGDHLDADWARTALRRTLLYACSAAVLAWALGQGKWTLP